MARNNLNPLSIPQQPLVLPEMIGFRLDADSTRILMARAAERKISPGEFARACVIEMMHQAESSADLQKALIRLKDGLEMTSARHALGVEALLVSAGKVESAEALLWVNANLR